MNQKLLNHFSQHINLDEKDIPLIDSKAIERQYLKGQYILQSGDISNAINFIVEGAVRIFYIDKSGKEHVVLLGVENWWIGDISSFLNQSPAAYNIQCVEPTKVIRFGYYEREELLSKVPILNRYFRIISENAYIASQERLIRNFAMTAKERYEFFSQKYPDHINRFPQYMIASYLGVTKEFLSKTRSQQKTNQS